MKIIKSSVASPEVIRLFSEHDDFMIELLGGDGASYTRYGEHEKINDVWVAYCGDRPVGCAAYRAKSPGAGELKRMFVRSEYAGAVYPNCCSPPLRNTRGCAATIRCAWARGSRSNRRSRCTAAPVLPRPCATDSTWKWRRSWAVTANDVYSGKFI